MAKCPATQLTLRKLRAEGHALVEIVEHWNSFSRRREDMFGILDVVAITGDGRTVGVQTTSFGNSSSRRRKILESDALPVLLQAEWTIIVHGWKKVGGRWVCHRDQVIDWDVYNGHWSAKAEA